MAHNVAYFLAGMFTWALIASIYEGIKKGIENRRQARLNAKALTCRHGTIAWKSCASCAEEFAHEKKCDLCALSYDDRRGQHWCPGQHSGRFFYGHRPEQIGYSGYSGCAPGCPCRSIRGISGFSGISAYSGYSGFSGYSGYIGSDGKCRPRCVSMTYVAGKSIMQCLICGHLEGISGSAGGAGGISGYGAGGNGGNANA